MSKAKDKEARLKSAEYIHYLKNLLASVYGYPDILMNLMMSDQQLQLVPDATRPADTLRSLLEAIGQSARDISDIAVMLRYERPQQVLSAETPEERALFEAEARHKWGDLYGILCEPKQSYESRFRLALDYMQRIAQESQQKSQFILERWSHLALTDEIGGIMKLCFRNVDKVVTLLAEPNSFEPAPI